jgi:chromosome segregation ATPase
VNTKTDVLDVSIPLAESMDQSIGEASTMLGAVVTELLRRSLRGGVVKIGEGLQTYVTGEVATALTARAPEVERAAVAAAEQTAQIAAAKIAAEEVHALDVKTGEAARQLASQIEEVDRKTRGAVEEKAQVLAGRIDEVDRRAIETTRQTAEQLGGQIVEAEKRVSESRAEIDQRLDKVLEKSREVTANLKARLKSVEELSEGLGRDLRQEQATRKGELQAGFARLQQGLDRLKEEVGELRKANEELSARVKALEHPKGFFSRLFGRRKDQGEAEA